MKAQIFMVVGQYLGQEGISHHLCITVPEHLAVLPIILLSKKNFPLKGEIYGPLMN